MGKVILMLFPPEITLCPGRTHLFLKEFFFFSNSKRTYTRTYLDSLIFPIVSGLIFCIVLPKSKEWSWVTDGHFFTKRTYLGEFDLQNGAPPKLCQCPILSSAPYKQLILSKKLYQQKCACSILWRKRLPALPYKVNSRHIFDF